eukprot:359687-Chlamydomonas_euryale.AAC.7
MLLPCTCCAARHASEGTTTCMRQNSLIVACHVKRSEPSPVGPALHDVGGSFCRSCGSRKRTGEGGCVQRDARPTWHFRRLSTLPRPQRSRPKLQALDPAPRPARPQLRARAAAGLATPRALPHRQLLENSLPARQSGVAACALAAS